jgi:DNA-directed RNA polymerase II subunit RPB1
MRIFERAAYMRGAGDVDDPALSRASVHARVHAVCARIAGLTASPDALLPYLVAIRFSFRSANACASLREVGFVWALGEMYESAKRALVHPGKSVGVLAAQSVGEPLTQLTLNTFHLSGVSSIHQTQGIPRFKELVDMTKNGKAEVMAVSLLPDVSREEAERLAESWVQTTLLDVGAFVRSSSNPGEGGAAGLDRAAQARLQMALIFDPPPAGLDHVVMAEQFVFNKDVMVARSITLEDMRRAVQGKWDAAERAASPAVPVHGRFATFEQPDTTWRLLLCCYTLGEHAADADVRRRLLDQLNLVAKQRLFGLEGVSATAVQPTDSGGPDDQEPTVLDVNVPARGHVITTAGTCLEDVVAIEHVDADLTYGSDVHEMYALYGIEAAAHLLYSEFFRTLSYDGNYINSRHLLMLVDFMTHTGALIPLSRFGINRLQRGVLQRCSFEEATDMLENAGFFGEADHMNGVSQSVIAGAPVKFGTGYHSAVETTIVSPCQQEQRADAEFVKPNVKRSRVRSRINTAPNAFELRFEKPGSNTPYSPPTP